MGPIRDIDDIDFDEVFKILEKGFKGMERGFDTLDGTEAKKMLDVHAARFERVKNRIRSDAKVTRSRINKGLDEFEKRRDEAIKSNDIDGFMERKSQAMKSVVKMVVIVAAIFIVLVMGAMVFSLINSKSHDLPQLSTPPIETPAQPGDLKKL